MKIDFHAHTRHSDGTYTPTALIEEAKRRGVAVQAVTDHDTVAGVPEAEAAGAALGVRVVWGVEFSTRDEAAGDVHVLGFFKGKPDAAFLALLERQLASRRERAEAMLVTLNGMGKPLTWDDLKAAGASDSSVGRPHVARALVAKGFCANVPEAFKRWLGPGRPAYVKHRVPAPEEAVKAIRAAGGVPGTAHPGRLRDSGVLERMAAAGLLALEVYHPDHRPEQIASLEEFARNRNLIPTGGSDFHGLEGDRFAKLGDRPTPPSSLDRIEAFWKTGTL